MIVLIHGLWMNGLEMTWFRRRMRDKHGFRARQFSYHSMSRGIDENVRRLSEFLDGIPGSNLHLVGHSLGGVLALQTLKRFPTDKVGRVVCLGSPLVDSSAARNLSRWSWGGKLLGDSLREAVLEAPLGSSDANHEVGVIAGTLPLGFGSCFGHLERPHDGVVTEKETRLPGLTDHLALRVSHFGLVLSRRAADQTACFLRQGKFDRAS